MGGGACTTGGAGGGGGGATAAGGGRLVYRGAALVGRLIVLTVVVDATEGTGGAADTMPLAAVRKG